jgi:hypothetical protein
MQKNTKRSPLKACEDKIYRETRVSFDSGFPIGGLGNDKVGIAHILDLVVGIDNLRCHD